MVYGYLRVSSERQTWGDGERRQDQELMVWCARKGWTLSDRRFFDPGVSAWKGKNRQEGAFAELLKVVKPGDVIALEDHDRFSRERTPKSLAALEDIVNKGVMVVFTKTGLEVTAQNFHTPEVLFSNFFGAYLANTENEKKAERIKAAMATKREQIKAGRLPFGMLPPWLRWNLPPKHPDRKIVVIEERASLVRYIFALCLSGKGVRRIEKTLNAQPALTKCWKVKWNMRGLLRLLRDRSVLGFHHSGAKVYERIVDEQVFYGAAATLGSRKNVSAVVRSGNKSLFTGLCHCKCGATMTRQQVVADGRTYTYLLCSDHLRGRSDCKAKGLAYARLESSFLDLISTNGLRQLLAGPAAPSNVAVVEAQLADTEKRYQRVLKSIEVEDNPDLTLRLKELAAERTGLRAQVEAEKAKTATVLPPVMVLGKTINLLAKLDQPGVRAEVRQGIRQFVTRIDIDGAAKTYTLHFTGTSDFLRVNLVKDGSYWLAGRTKERLPDWARPAVERLERKRGQRRQRRRAARGAVQPGDQAGRRASGQAGGPGADS